MKRSILVAVFILVFALTSSITGAANIEIISQTYRGSIGTLPPKPFLIERITTYLDGINATYTVGYNDFDSYIIGSIISHQPIDMMPSDYFSGYGFDAGVELINQYTMQISASAVHIESPRVISDIVFSPVATSYIDISAFIYGMAFGSCEFKLVDVVTNVELLNMKGGGYIPSSGIYISDLIFPVTPSGIYEFVLVADASHDDVRPIVTITAIPEPTSLLLFGSGLLGLIAGRKMFNR